MRKLILWFITCLVCVHAEELRVSSAPYISGDTFRSYADHLFDETFQDFNPLSVKYGDIIFVKGDLLSRFISAKHNHITQPYVLVVHNSDEPMPGEFAGILNDGKILLWYAQNIENFSHPKLRHLPIGLANRRWNHGSTECVERVKGALPSIEKGHLLYLNFSVDTHRDRRWVHERFCGEPYCYVSRPKPFGEYLRELASCKFALSPRGNGIDCHRTWEALYMGVIPIVKASSLDPMYEGLPVLIVNDWNEINEGFLERKYAEFAERQWNLEKLYSLYWYKELTQFKSDRKICADGLPNLGKKLDVEFSREPIDVVIPCAEKDLPMLELCIQSIHRCCNNVRKIYVISSKRLTNSAEWFDESRFPFSRYDVALALTKSESAAMDYLNSGRNRSGWFLQQLLKLYAPFVIPDISSNILVVDADVVFLRPLSLQGEKGEPFFNVTSEYYLPYFRHMNRFLPGLTRVIPQYSGISHYMLFQKPILEDLFRAVKALHGKELWKAFCDEVSQDDIWFSGASEYEIYFNYTLARCSDAKIRLLKMKNVESLSDIRRSAAENYDYVAYHSYSRPDNVKQKR